MAEQWEDKLLVYLYDASGSPIGMMYRTTSYASNTWDTFWFAKNLFGDIVAIYNESGTKVVSYSYTDAWGNHSVSYSNGGGSTGAKYNPFRYRGYYYDTDLGMYYLQSRYYDARICRFISPDDTSVIAATPMALTDKNLYAYCDNNPVMRVDEDGEFWIPIVAGAFIGGLLGAITAIKNEQNVLTGTLIGATLGAAAGAIVGSGNIGMISGGLSSVAGRAATDAIGLMMYGTEPGGWEDYTIAFVCGGLTGNLEKTSYAKMIIDAAIVPAMNQSVKAGTRGNPLDATKYVYDLATRSIALGIESTLVMTGLVGNYNLSVNLGKCFYRATTKALYPYLEPYYN